MLLRPGAAATLLRSFALLRVLQLTAQFYAEPSSPRPSAAPTTSVEEAVLRAIRTPEPTPVGYTFPPSACPSSSPTKYAGKLPPLPRAIPSWFTAAALQSSGFSATDTDCRGLNTADALAACRHLRRTAAAEVRAQLHDLEVTVAESLLNRTGRSPNATQILVRTMTILNQAHRQNQAAGNGKEAAQMTLARPRMS